MSRTSFFHILHERGHEAPGFDADETPEPGTAVSVQFPGVREAAFDGFGTPSPDCSAPVREAILPDAFPVILPDVAGDHFLNSGSGLIHGRWQSVIF